MYHKIHLTLVINSCVKRKYNRSSIHLRGNSMPIAQCEQGPDRLSQSGIALLQAKPFLWRTTFVIRSTKNVSHSMQKGNSEKCPIATTNKLAGSFRYVLLLLTLGVEPYRLPEREKSCFPDAPYLKSCRLRFFKSHYFYIHFVRH